MSQKDDKDSSQDELTLNMDVQEGSQSLDDDKNDAMNDLLQPPDVESERNSPKLSPPQAVGDADLEGAVGGVVESGHLQQKDIEQYIDINRQASVLDKKGLCPGKLEVFRKYFDREDLLFCTRPDTRRRHTAKRQRHCSEGNQPNSDKVSSNGFAVGYVPNFESGVEPLLNQAGAIIGYSGKPSEFANIRGDGIILPGFGRIKEPKHSIGSAETVPIGEIYSGNFSPARPSSASSRGVSPGSSFPSFSSRPQTGSDSYVLKISPLPDSGSTAEETQVSPASADSEMLHDGSVRQRKFGVSQPIPVPVRPKAGHSMSASCPEESSLAKFPKRKISKDSSEFSERVSSEDEGIPFPELSQSVESDHGPPTPDLNKAALDNLEQNLRSLELSLNILTEVSAQGEIVLSPGQETESESEQDPVTVMSCSPDGTKDLEYPPADE